MGKVQYSSKSISKADEGSTSKTARVYALIRILSLDVAVGALGGGLMAAAVLGQNMPLAWYITLPLAVWLIYTLDHLMDAHRLGARAHTERHLFHHRNFGSLIIIWMILAPLCLIIALVGLPVEGVYFGLAMLGLVAGHLLMVKLIGDTTAPWLMKEVGVGIIYAAGIWGLPLILQREELTTFDGLFFLQFLLLALCNLLEFSIFEYETDKIDGHTSFVRAIGIRRAKTMIAIFLGLSVLAGCLIAFQMGMEGLKIQMVFFAMAGILYFILLFPAFFSVNERYRVWGDAAFLFPFLFPLL